MSYTYADLRFRPLRAKPVLGGRSSGRPFKITLHRPDRIVVAIVANIMLGLMLMAVITAAPMSFTGGFTDVVTHEASQASTVKASTKVSTKTSKKALVTKSASRVLGPAAVAYFSQFNAADAAARKANAKLIVALGNKRNLSVHSAAIAVGTSIQESGLRNLTWGDDCSLGLFQQRPCIGSWGTAQQILNPTHAINQFYDRLVRIPDRDKRSMMQVALQIQRPNPKFYYRDWKWDVIATQIVKYYSVAKATARG